LADTAAAVARDRRGHLVQRAQAVPADERIAERQRCGHSAGARCEVAARLAGIYPDDPVRIRRSRCISRATGRFSCMSSRHSPVEASGEEWSDPDELTEGTTMSQDLSGTVIAITGASSGIGEATALAAARAGAAVALAARRSDRIEALAQRIEADGGRAIAITADVGEEDQANAFVSRAHAELGRLDALVNNAGVMLLGPVSDAPTEEWRRMIHVNVFGVLYCTHAALPLMRAQGGGTIVNISSVAGRHARPGAAVYALTKFGVGAFSEALRQEVAGDDIRVALVEPGMVATELITHNREEIIERSRAQFADVTPLAPDDIANAILFVVGQPANVAINELLVRPTRQTR
jgi:clavulanate-9-aldehyde reductase